MVRLCYMRPANAAGSIGCKRCTRAALWHTTVPTVRKPYSRTDKSTNLMWAIWLSFNPCMLYAEDFFCWATAWIDCSQAPSYCVNWLFTSCSTSSTSHRGFPCVLPNIYGSSRRSLGRLLDVDNPSTFSTTTRLAAIADIVANRRRKFMV